MIIFSKTVALYIRRNWVWAIMRNCHVFRDQNKIDGFQGLIRIGNWVTIWNPRYQGLLVKKNGSNYFFKFRSLIINNYLRRPIPLQPLHEPLQQVIQFNQTKNSSVTWDTKNDVIVRDWRGLVYSTTRRWICNNYE